MNRRLDEDVREWLKAEREGLDELAEHALTRALGGLGRRAPRPGFADRVLVRAGCLSAPAGWTSWWVRGAVAAAILSAGLAVATLPVWLLVADPIARAFGSPLVSMTAHWTGRVVAAAFASWAVIEDVASALQASFATPTVLALLLANALLAGGSLFGLRRLLKAPEELMPW